MFIKLVIQHIECVTYFLLYSKALSLPQPCHLVFQIYACFIFNPTTSNDRSMQGIPISFHIIIHFGLVSIFCPLLTSPRQEEKFRMIPEYSHSHSWPDEGHLADPSSNGWRPFSTQNSRPRLKTQIEFSMILRWAQNVTEAEFRAQSKSSL